MFCRTLAYLLALTPSEMGSLGYLLPNPIPQLEVAKGC